MTAPKVPTPLVYVDTSIYLAILLGEKAGLSWASKLAKRTLCSSSLMILEAERNLVRLSRSGNLSEEDYQIAFQRVREDKDKFVLREFNLRLCLTGQYPAVQVPRSLDLVHLRTALWFYQHGGMEGFASLDQNQIKTARELGLPIL